MLLSCDDLRCRHYDTLDWFLNIFVYEKTFNHANKEQNLIFFGLNVVCQWLYQFSIEKPFFDDE
jgi:hypothetical protein